MAYSDDFTECMAWIKACARHDHVQGSERPRSDSTLVHSWTLQDELASYARSDQQGYVEEEK